MKIAFTVTAVICSLFTTLAFSENKMNVGWPEIKREAKPWTRWWWMGSDIDSVGLSYNLSEMSKAGIGGVEVTPIYGVIGREKHYIDYLSPRWMDMFSLTESMAKRLEITVDLNMGTGWPFGGPEVSIKDAATKAIFQRYNFEGGQLIHKKIAVEDEKQIKYAFLSSLMAYAPTGEKIELRSKVDTSGYLRWKAPSNKKWTLVALFIGKTLQKVKRAAPGGEGYVLNHFDKEAVQHYFSKYDAAFKKGKMAFPHSFFNDSYEVYGADWTPDFLEQFEYRRRYRLQDYFPELLADGSTEKSVRVISDYRETIAELLKENFTMAWSKWAHQRGITTRNQAHGSPANLLDLYASVDIPECETFGITNFNIPYLRKDSIRKSNDGDPTTLKYASSAAHIAGKKYTSCEIFTWLTEHFRTSLSQCKPEIDQVFTSGVNHVYFHGYTYSPQEAAWPGWKFYASVDMSPTNTIWQDAPAFFSYVTRVQSFLQEGSPDNDFLLYMPVYDIWEKQRGSYYSAFAIHDMRDRLPDFYRAVENIRQLGYDLDYISDHFIQTTLVENGRLKTEGGTTYKALIVPSAKTLPLKTLNRIKQLAEQGATIVFVGQYPSDVPGLQDLDKRRKIFRKLIKKLPPISGFDTQSIKTFGKGKIITGNDMSQVLHLCNASQEPFVTDCGGQLIRRRNKDGYHYFFVMLQDKPVNGWVSLGVEGESAMFFDPMTGKKGKAAIRNVDGITQVYMQLKPGESIILKTFTNVDVQAEKWIYYQLNSEVSELREGWKMHFINSEPAITDTFCLQELGSWTELGKNELKHNMGTAVYTNQFNLKKRAGCEYKLSLGDVRESANIRINGKPAGILFSVPFETNIGALLKDGDNTVEIAVTNLPANRIADYDRQGLQWRIFHEINFVSITYKPTLFDTWDVVPSGLLGPVRITELKQMTP